MTPGESSKIGPNGGISSSNYREHDALLLNQTRIWLGKVLNQSIDGDLSGLLANGRILFDVYKKFREMLIILDPSSQQNFPESESVSSTQITEKYQNPKVAWFLEICRSFGLSDVDLFTTSDVAHKTNTVKVCTCLRTLSIKARLKDPTNLEIPEFDSVRTNLENASSSAILVGSPVNNPDGDCGVESAETVQHTVNQSSNSGCENDLSDKVTSAGSSVGTDNMEASGSPLPVEVGSAENVQHTSNRTSDCREMENHSNSGCENTENDLPDESPIAEDERKNIAQQCKLSMTMLKWIAGGTAVGFMLYFLQPRKKRKENAASK